nr:hypothetical protein [uncultured Desulfuromonas sp.]
MSGTPWEAYGLIAHLAQKLYEDNFGKTKLQKIVYLLQRLKNISVGYNYTFYTYGPFSSDLAADLDYIKNIEGIKIDYDPSINMYGIHPAENTSRLTEKASEFLSANKAEIDEIINRFGKRQAKELELSATLVFVQKSGITNEDELLSRVKELKPKFTESEIRESLDELRKWKYLS